MKFVIFFNRLSELNDLKYTNCKKLQLYSLSNDK